MDYICPLIIRLCKKGSIKTKCQGSYSFPNVAPAYGKELNFPE